MFSAEGVLADRTASPLIHLFPNLLARWDSPFVISTMLVLGTALSVLLAAGVRDRWAAVGVWYALACLFGRNPLIANPSLPFIGWLLLAHAVLPRAPYGSWEARGRPDPGGGWRMAEHIFLLAWVLMAVGRRVTCCSRRPRRCCVSPRGARWVSSCSLRRWRSPVWSGRGCGQGC